MATSTVPNKKAEQEARKKMSDFIDDVVNAIESTPVKSSRRRKIIAPSARPARF